MSASRKRGVETPIADFAPVDRSGTVASGNVEPGELIELGVLVADGKLEDDMLVFVGEVDCAIRSPKNYNI
jgi:hypothetical protein